MVQYYIKINKKTKEANPGIPLKTGQYVALGVKCPQPPPTNKPTPYGEWICSSNGTWVWVPELG